MLKSTPLLTLNEGWTDGGIVVEDCLRLLLNLLRNNPSNQTFFKEGSYINRIKPALDVFDTEVKIGHFIFFVGITIGMSCPLYTVHISSGLFHLLRIMVGMPRKWPTCFTFFTWFEPLFLQPTLVM